MNYKQEVIHLRNEIPISFSEALRLVSENNGDIHQSKQQYISSKIDHIIQVTGESYEVVKSLFYDLKFDSEKCISTFKKEQKIESYLKTDLANLSHKSFEMIDQWFLLENHEGLHYVLLNDDVTDAFLNVILNNLGMNNLHFLLLEVRNKLKKVSEKDLTIFIQAVNQIKMGREYRKLLSELDMQRNELENELFYLREAFCRY